LLTWGDLAYNSAYFVTPLAGFGIDINNISIALPYGQVNPSDCFGHTATALGTNVANGSGECANVHFDTLFAGNPDATGTVPNTGNVNGLGPIGFPANGGPDFVAQTDYNTGFDVPEPGSLALIALGLAGLGARAKRVRKGA
jgi:hypothetical protein